MSKICGIINYKKNIKNDSLIDLMTLSMKHEDWHRIDLYKDNNINLGHISLGKINKEKQPIWNKDKTIVIIMCGKIFDYDKEKGKLIEDGYNFKYKNNDAEFILAQYINYGLNKNWVRKLNGIFNFVIYDKNKNESIIVNDRYGFNLLYFYKKRKKLLFASEIKAIVKDKTIKRKINWKFWSDSLYLQRIQGEDTPFKNIDTIPAASILKINKRKIKIEKYWDYSEIKMCKRTDEEYYIGKICKLFEQAIKRQIKDLKECICLLSGGYDSRVIVSMLANLNNIEIKTYTTRKDDNSYLDNTFAKFVASKLNVNNTYVALPNNLYKKYFLEWLHKGDYLQPMHIWLLPLIKSLKNSTPINFDGISGDVLLKGLFMGEENLRYINKNQKEVALYILSKNKENKNILNLVFNKRISNKIFKKAIRSIKEELNKINENSNKITLFYMKNRTRREISIAPNNFINLKTENYFPFMDNDLVKFSLSIPPKLKVKNKIYKKALKRMFPEIMKIPSTNDEGIQKSKYAQKKAEIIRNSKESLNYFHELCQKFKLPKKILNLQYLDYVKKEIEKGKYPKGLEEYLRFVIWYNEYMA